MKRFFNFILPILVGFIVGLIIRPYMDYNNLIKPVLAPKGFIFPIVWTILYVLMGISSLRFKNVPSIYYVQIFVNGFWSILFFVFKMRFISFIWIILLDILIIYMLYVFRKKDKISFYLNIPYLLWSLFASYLNLMFYILN